MEIRITKTEKFLKVEKIAKKELLVRIIIFSIILLYIFFKLYILSPILIIIFPILLLFEYAFIIKYLYEVIIINNQKIVIYVSLFYRHLKFCKLFNFLQIYDIDDLKTIYFKNTTEILVSKVLKRTESPYHKIHLTLKDNSYTAFGVKLKDEVAKEIVLTINKFLEKYIKENKIKISELEPKYDCEKCKDTGYIIENGLRKKCDCLVQEIININYNISNLKSNGDNMLEKFSFDYYSEEKKENEKNSPRELAKKAYDGAKEFIKNPVVLEFLDLPTNMSYTENELEKALTDDIQKFMMELGKGFAFVERQQHIRTENSDFYIDLVFYNYILKCFVIVELKTEKLTHQDIGQLDMYVRMYDDLKKQENDNPTIGLLLCTETDRTIIKYSVLNDNKNLFASKYVNYLPSEEELINEIERQKTLFESRNNNEMEY